ncbi:hypothetical protein BGW36DRAFT_446236 [Talaromyces proteolyticus]|uniref:Uncharacterized protein n=1 Tax=Talaromyces proteolyticus TaxID=1131652 RepID=A0AAD4Q4D9_9EURO|nr:uncharacterized protein BGW36DRAFT_446236 [Talaromyces proteolyticus]KAH8702562.1 hypothetical protein BGW36DRAFT_446236 [Talaromyces proteolyticus]
MLELINTEEIRRYSSTAVLGHGIHDRVSKTTYSHFHGARTLCGFVEVSRLDAPELVLETLAAEIFELAILGAVEAERRNKFDGSPRSLLFTVLMLILSSLPTHLPFPFGRRFPTALPSTKMTDNQREQHESAHRWGDVLDKEIHSLPNLSDSDLRDLLSTPQEDRHSRRLKFDPTVAFRYIPREFKGQEIKFDLALSHLKTRLNDTLFNRLRAIPGYFYKLREKEKDDNKFVIY